MPIVAPSPQAQPRKTRLLIVNSTLHIGGAEQVAACLAEHLNRATFETAACYLKEPGLIADQMLRSGVDLVPIPGLRPGRRDYLTFLKLRRLIRSRRIEVIHTHDVHGMIDGAACRLTTPGLRFVHTFHYGNYPDRRIRHKFIEGALSRVADVLIAVSHSQAAAIRKLYQIPESRIRVVWNGVDEPKSSEEAPGLQWGIPPGTPVIASISTLIPQKGLEHLLEAAALLRRAGERFVLLIAGDGPLRQVLLARSEALGLQGHVQFLGWVPQASSKVFPLCDIFVQSSLWEAMSIVLLEAMASAKPVVATSVGENPLVMLPGETGLMVPPANPAALAQALRTLLHDPPLRIRMGQAARARYQELFTVQHMIAAHEQLYRELAGAPR
jgi:glycosyltransferase involved in cell wall biosynthesis